LSREAGAKHAVDVESFPSVRRCANENRCGFPESLFGLGVYFLLKPDPAEIRNGHERVNRLWIGDTTLHIEQLAEHFFGVRVLTLIRVVLG
jgi:hypothetical protein